MPEQCLEYKLGPDVHHLTDITWYGIPYPTLAPYTPYGVVRLCGNMTSKGYGFPTAEWRWSSLTQDQVWCLLNMFDNETDASKEIHMRTYKDSGNLREAEYFKAVMYRPVDNQGKNLVPGSRFAYADVVVRFAHLLVESWGHPI